MVRFESIRSVSGMRMVSVRLTLKLLLACILQTHVEASKCRIFKQHFGARLTA
jgi:hypothetical protein